MFSVLFVERFTWNVFSFITSKIQSEFGRPAVLFERLSPAFLTLLRKRNHPYVFVLDSFAPHPRQLRQARHSHSYQTNISYKYPLLNNPALNHHSCQWYHFCSLWKQIVSDQGQTWNCTLRYCSVFERLFSPTACGSTCTLSLSPALTGGDLHILIVFNYFSISIILYSPALFYHFRLCSLIND